MKRQAIVEGDKFRSRNGEVWTITEALGFGRGYWVVSADRCRQTIYQRNVLEQMQRVEVIPVELSAETFERRSVTKSNQRPKNSRAVKTLCKTGPTH